MTKVGIYVRSHNENCRTKKKISPLSSVHNYFSDGEKEKVIEVEIHKLVERQQSNSRPFCFTAPLLLLPFV